MSTHTEPSVEHVRPRLERLRRTLRHWQICSTEYEALKKLLILSPEASREEIVRVAQFYFFSEGKLTELKLAVGIEFSGKLVDEKGLLIEVSRKFHTH